MSAVVKPGYKLTEVGLIPEDWNQASVFSLAGSKKERFDDGDWIEAEFLSDSGVRLIQTGNIGEGFFVDKEVKKYISEESYRLLRCKEVQAGDLLICRLADPAGRACLMPVLEEKKLITAVDVTIFRPLEEIADKGYLVQVFSTKPWFEAVNERCGGSTRTRIARGELAKITIPHPPLLEQRAIASALSDMDALISGLDQLIAKKRDIKQAAMQQLLTGQTRLPGFSGEWRCVRAGEIGKFRGGNGFPVKYQGESASDYPFYKVSDMNNEGNETFMSEANNWISESSRKKIGATVFPGGSIIFAKVGAAVFLERKKILKWPSCIDNNLAALEIDKSVADVRFIHYALLNVRFGSLVSTTALPSLNGATLSQITVPLPEIAEQREIASILSEIDAELDLLEGRLAKSHAIKMGMMQELLTGRIRLV